VTSIERLLATFGDRGHRARAVPLERLQELRRETEALSAHELVAPELRERYLPDGFDFYLGRRDPALRSAVVVATPTPQVRLTFHDGGRTVAAPLGPGYVDRYGVLERVKALAAEVLGSSGHRTAPVVLPKKLLAARTGLGRYGRNNLLYVEGMGSFHRLTAFATDAPCPDDAPWEEAQLLGRCETCTACLRTCPTGAIGGDRFLLHAERCLAFFNEKPFPFPAWLDPAWHECLVGCMTCQRRCPENRTRRDELEDAATFSEEETAALLAACGPEELPAALRERLAALALLPYLPVLARNLRALVYRNARNAARAGGGAESA
jgi:epoxyqueuosine reductase